ncbi:hypothetical protein MKX79_14545 [Viridibacillus sp. FSL R5-0468]
MSKKTDSHIRESVFALLERSIMSLKYSWLVVLIIYNEHMKELKKT